MYKTKLAGEEKTCRVEALCGKLDLVRKFAGICGVPPAHQDDVVQDVMVAAYLHLDQLRDMDHFDGWLFRIMKRKAGHFFAAQKKRMEREACLEDWQEQQFQEPDAYQAWQAAERAIDDETLCRMVNSLSPPAPAIIRMRFEAGFTLKEIAEMLEMNYNTVKTIEHRAFKALKAMIIKEEEQI